MFLLEGGLGPFARGAKGHSESRNCHKKAEHPSDQRWKKQTLGLCLGNLNVSQASDVRMETK